MAKKIKKVETPIDRRETFVSIQKHFADNDQEAEEKLKTLYALQQADTELDKIFQLRGELPEEVSALEAEIEELKARNANLAAVIEGFNKKIDAEKQNIIECQTQILHYKNQLESISNSREFDSINKEIENQDLLRQISEKNINESKEAIEQKRQEMEKVKDYMAVREDDLAAKKEELSGIIESTAATEEKLRAHRDACAAKIADERVMSAYERIRKSVHNHLAVVTVYNGNSCGGCFNTVTPQRLIDISTGRKLIICEHCGRIIVSAKTEA